MQIEEEEWSNGGLEWSGVMAAWRWGRQATWP